MTCAKGLFSDRQRALVEPLSLAVLALRQIQVGQVVESLPHVGVVRTERFLADRQGALVQALRLAVIALLPMHESQFVERNSVICMVGSEACPLELLCIDLGGG